MKKNLFDVLNALPESGNPPIHPKELCRVCDVSPSTIFRRLRTLRKRGLAWWGGRGKYVLSSGFERDPEHSVLEHERTLGRLRRALDLAGTAPRPHLGMDLDARCDIGADILRQDLKWLMRDLSARLDRIGKICGRKF